MHPFPLSVLALHSLRRRCAISVVVTFLPITKRSLSRLFLSPEKACPPPHIPSVTDDPIYLTHTHSNPVIQSFVIRSVIPLIAYAPLAFLLWLYFIKHVLPSHRTAGIPHDDPHPAAAAYAKSVHSPYSDVCFAFFSRNAYSTRTTSCIVILATYHSGRSCLRRVSGLDPAPWLYCFSHSALIPATQWVYLYHDTAGTNKGVQVELNLLATSVI